MSTHKKSHLEIDFRTLHYLMGILYSKIQNIVQTMIQSQEYIDVTWCSCQDTFKSIDAYAFTRWSESIVLF